VSNEFKVSFTEYNDPWIVDVEKLKSVKPQGKICILSN